MNFFDAHDRAKQATRWLVIVYLTAAALIVAGVAFIVAVALRQSGATPNPAVPLAAGVVAGLFILGATLYKTSILSAGGSRVAHDMGGTPVPADVQDPLRRRLRNVVEEMAIASGVPVPDIFVLESEAGINAFAAGYSPGDAAVAVTRGTLELLDRDELQGVIAHEFSHILNGDMRLNIRLMGVLFGIMVVGLIGRMVLRGSYHGGLVSSRRNRNAPAVMMVGLGLAILGWIGVFMARLIKAAVSRQREFLADASAVQFTRQTSGIANALKKIGGYTEQSFIKGKDPEEVSHMLFAGGLPKLAGMFATHPPLRERIVALEPEFANTPFPEVSAPLAAAAATPTAAVGFAESSRVTAGQVEAPVGNDIADSIGQPNAEQIGFARALRRSIPPSLDDAAHSTESAWLLTVALVMDAEQAPRQFAIVESQLGPDRTARAREFFEELQSVGPAYRLPLLEIAFPALKRRPIAELEFLLDLVRRLVESDGEVDLREYCYYRIIARHLEQAIEPSGELHHNRVSKRDARDAALALLGIVADSGHADAAARDVAFEAGAAHFGDWARENPPAHAPELTVATLDHALDVLAGLNSSGRRSMIAAVSATIASDGKLTTTEAELLRAVCASLDCPLPPFPGVA